MKKFNEFADQIMDKIADSLSTKACFVIFCIISFVPLAIQMPHDILGWQQWISQTAIQLIALSVLAIVSKKEGREQRRVMEETHDAVMAEMSIVKEELDLAREERDEMKQIMDEIHENTKEGICNGNG